VLDHGNPGSGVEIFLGAKPGTNHPCSEVGEPVQVSAVDGSFRVPAVSKTVLSQSLLNPPSRTSSITAICVRRPADREAQIGALLWMFIEKPVSMSVSCELSVGMAGGMGNGQLASPLGQAQLCRANRAPQDNA